VYYGAWKWPRTESCHAPAMFHCGHHCQHCQHHQTRTGAQNRSLYNHRKLSRNTLPNSAHPLAQQLTEINAAHLEILMQALWEHRETSLPKKPTAPTKAETCSGIESLSMNMHHKITVLQRISFLRNQQHNPFTKQSLPPSGI
jgi:hypothetical protein